ncbi:MAG: phosphatase PAP2 family protein [Bdellovibrionaceae bacterium]|nr:phosphatase PAP2 family protein [Pseudobdellovibrionaceae bacterium]MBX3033818.1 phosphatase PAP2 family protein [Pseudobdellovibrionaceae bacterium]
MIFSFGLLATGLSLVFVDQDLALWFNEVHRESIRLAARSITNIALGEYWFGLAILIYVWSRWVRKNDNLRSWAVHLFAGLLGSGIILQILKWSFGRQRPHVGEAGDHLVFHPFQYHWHYLSMPSGHTQVLFSVATALVLLWPGGRWIFFGLAAALSFTRVMILQHYLSDVIAGAMVGFFGTLWVYAWLEKKVPKPRPLIGGSPKNR